KPNIHYPKLSENKNSLGEPRISPKPSDYILPNNVTKIYSPTPFDKEPYNVSNHTIPSKVYS
ncbi:hypothetical protein, partial [Ureibacillus thermosphaericus]|uniref:hypothetical protein n=1 Tax=Ureibacillus thermosphaericus TaxID=51173 RepID=UPI0030C9C2D8